MTYKVPNPVKRAPLELLPGNACDCHFHIFDHHSTLVDGRMYTPEPCTYEDYRQLSTMLGLQRGVVVQPSVYGTDNRSTLAAVARSPETLRAVVSLEDNVSDDELELLHTQGVRGVRVNVAFGDTYDKATFLQLASRIKNLGWHIQLLVDVSKFQFLFDDLVDVPVPLVFDHMGNVPVERGTSEQGFQQLLKWLHEGKAWVKLSGAYRTSNAKEAPFADTRPFALELLKANPEQCVWGSDWPHPQLDIDMPDDTDLLDMASTYLSTSDLRNAVFVSNPDSLYHFSS